MQSLINDRFYPRYSEIPSEEALVQAAFDVLNSSSSWKAGKTFHKVVRTYSKSKGPGDGAPWHARVSEHTAEDATFDEFWSKLGEDHAQNEKEYVFSDYCTWLRKQTVLAVAQIYQGGEEVRTAQEDLANYASVEYVLRVSPSGVTPNLHRASTRAPH